jgi:hypothetical protein
MIIDAIKPVLITTAVTIATSLSDSRFDYCNSLNLTGSQFSHLQFIFNATSRALTRTPEILISPVLKSPTGSKLLKAFNLRHLESSPN